MINVNSVLLTSFFTYISLIISITFFNKENASHSLTAYFYIVIKLHKYINQYKIIGFCNDKY